MKKRYSLKMVEKGKLSVGDYLNHRINNLKPYQGKNANGVRLVLIKGSYLFLTPKVPFWILKYFGKLVKRIPNEYGGVDFQSFEIKDIVAMLKMLGKHNLIVGVSSPKENFQFEIWGA